MKKTNYFLTEDDVTPFVLDAEGNKLEVGDMVNTAGGIDYRITKIVCGEVDQMPMIQLTKITYRSPDEIIKLK
jgi:hypothetical protein